MSNQQKTAIHEAGHTVAQVRLGIPQLSVTIIPRGWRAGACLSECDPWSAEGALNQAIAYYCGWAACVVAGWANEEAREGCDDDFEAAHDLAMHWALPDGDAIRTRAVELMRENEAAVRLVAEHLVERKHLDDDIVAVLVEVADGEASSDDLERYLQLRDAQ